MLEPFKEIFRGYHEFKVEDTLSPSTLDLLKNCAWFEEEAQIVSLGIYPEKQTLAATFISVLGTFNGYIKKENEVTFSGVPDASATYKGKALARNEIVQVSYEHDVDFFEVSGTCLYEDRDKLFHTHVVKLIAEDLIVMFTFADVSFRKISEEK